ncbi:MAG: helix-turn-helix domain-containing protein [Verrucomicrobiota bacterium]
MSLVSVSLNALHAPPNALARSVAIIPPVLLVTFLEILLGQLRETVRKSEARPVAEGATHGTRVVPGDTSRVSRDTADVPSDTNHVPNVERLYHDDTRSVSQLEHLEQDEPTDVPGDTSDVPDDTKLEQPVSEDGTGLYHETGDVSRDTADDPSDTDDAPDLFQGEHLPHPTGTPIGPDGELDLDFDDRREAILALRHQGLTFREIAEHVGVSHSTVSRTVRQHETEGGVS